MYLQCHHLLVRTLPPCRQHRTSVSRSHLSSLQFKLFGSFHDLDWIDASSVEEELE
jgi:hypothetical protein